MKREELKELKIKLLRELSDILNLYPDLDWSFYLEFNRRFEVVKYLLQYASKDATVCDIGSQPFILSAMLRRLGYRVIAVDIEPEKYGEILRLFDISYIKADLERDRMAIGNRACDVAIFTEVLEHINPYYVHHTLYEINRVLKTGAFIILTTPNIASLFRRLKLLLGRNPVYRYHVKEYTKDEVENMLESAGFKVRKIIYSDIPDRTFLYPKNKHELRRLVEIESFADMLKFVMRNFNTINIARILAYPLLKLVPSLRMLIIAIAEKVSDVDEKSIKRWG